MSKVRMLAVAGMSVLGVMSAGVGTASAATAACQFTGNTTSLGPPVQFVGGNGSFGFSGTANFCSMLDEPSTSKTSTLWKATMARPHSVMIVGCATSALSQKLASGLRGYGCTYMMERPPSTISVAPVTKDASSLASQMIGQAISCGVAQRASSDVV